MGSGLFGLNCMLFLENQRMAGKEKSKEQLISELKEACQRLKRLERVEAERDRLKETLLECQDKLKTVFNSANDEIVFTDLNGTLVDVNYKIEDIYGYKPEEVIGKNYAEVGFLSPEDEQEAAEVVGDILEGKPGRIMELETYRKDGSKVFVEANSKLIIKDGEVKGFLNIIRDISERKEMEKVLRESEEKYRGLFEGASDAIFTVQVNEQGVCFVDANPAALRMFGCDYDDIVGRSPLDFSTLVQADGRASEEWIKEIAIAVGAGSQRSFEWINQRLDGTPFDAEVSVNRIEIGGKEYMQAVARDITERKHAEENLRKYQEHLRQRTEELEKAYAELKKLDNMKDAFLSSVSHELRTPLTSIRSFAEILLTYGGTEPDKQVEFIEIIQMESERLSRLINDLLDLSKMGAGKMVYRDDSVRLEEIIRKVAKAQHHLLQEKELNLDLQISNALPTVHVDPDRIHQVIANLLTNAIKFSLHGGDIRIQAETFEGKRSGEAQEWARVSVSDQGVGLEENNRERIFDKFHQVSDDTLTDKPKGAGLGLHICKEIISHYQGNIWVESEKGRGSTFIFTLPVVSDSPQSTERSDKEDTEKPQIHDKQPVVQRPRN